MVSQLLAITTHQLAVVIAVFADSCENPPGYSRGSCIGSLVSEGVRVYIRRGALGVVSWLHEMRG